MKPNFFKFNFFAGCFLAIAYTQKDEYLSSDCEKDPVSCLNVDSVSVHLKGRNLAVPSFSKI